VTKDDVKSAVERVWFSGTWGSSLFYRGCRSFWQIYIEKFKRIAYGLAYDPTCGMLN
jgi:hypothetical protein